MAEEPQVYQYLVLFHSGHTPSCITLQAHMSEIRRRLKPHRSIRVYAFTYSIIDMDHGREKRLRVRASAKEPNRLGLLLRDESVKLKGKKINEASKIDTTNRKIKNS